MATNADNIDEIVRVDESAKEQRKRPSTASKGREEEVASPDAEAPVDVESKPKMTHMPSSSRLKQQKLPAWQPILTAKTVLPLFFAVGVAFVLLGTVLLVYSNNVREFIYDYTNCVNSNNIKCSDFPALYNTNCMCTIKFELNDNFPAPVFIYYALKNFYQNHRRYVKSRDDKQLLGKNVTTLNTDCAPFDVDGGQIAPCGAIANSLFNDTFSFKYYNVSTMAPPISVGLLARDIAWTTDRVVKFRNPTSWDGTVKPKYWQRPVYNLSNTTDNNGYQNEDLIVWMRTAALPTFRKLFRRVDHHQTEFLKGLPKGNYTVDINYSRSILFFSSCSCLSESNF